MSKQPSPVVEPTSPLQPPVELEDLAPGQWQDLEPDDLTQYLSQVLWPDSTDRHRWRAARFSSAAYLYEERVSSERAVVKFYATKSKSSPEEYALREKQNLLEARGIGLYEGPLRVIRPLALHRATLILEHAEGLNLADVVAVRQSQPGRLQIALARVAELLATLHSRSADPAAEPDFERAARDGLEYAHELGEYGVVKGEPAILAGLQTAIDRWRSLSVMSAFTPCLVHGDATTTNFVLTQEGGVVAIDWERLKIADPAFDLGRLAAEVAHSAEGAGGSGEEIDALTQELIGHYRDHSPGSEADPGLLERARFYQAISMLRIARNGWVPRLARMTLVARAMALLNE